MPATYDRRKFMTYFASVGLGSTLLPGILWAQASNGADITVATIAAAEEMAGLKFDDAERTMMLDGLKHALGAEIEALHKIRCRIPSVQHLCSIQFHPERKLRMVHDAR